MQKYIYLSSSLGVIVSLYAGSFLSKGSEVIFKSSVPGLPQVPLPPAPSIET